MEIHSSRRRTHVVLALAATFTGVISIGAYLRASESPAPANTAASLASEFQSVEVASVSDAIETLYKTKAYMSHDMRPLAPTKFAGPAVTVRMTPEEHQEGAPAVQGMLEAIDSAPPGSVYVMVLEHGLNYAGIGGLMSTAMKSRGFAGAIVDGSARDLPQIQKLQFPVFSRGVAPSTTINHFRCTGINVPIVCAGVSVNPGDIITADLDGVVVVPKAKAADILTKAKALDNQEHQMIPFIEKYRSIREAVAHFGRI
jgi:regulator of RNase E activity RraA